MCASDRSCAGFSAWIMSLMAPRMAAAEHERPLVKHPQREEQSVAPPTELSGSGARDCRRWLRAAANARTVSRFVYLNTAATASAT